MLDPLSDGRWGPPCYGRPRPDAGTAPAAAPHGGARGGKYGARERAVQISIISDTHLPRRQRRLPEQYVERLRSADLILNAGDLLALPVLRELESYGPVVAVHGNVD